MVNINVSAPVIPVKAHHILNKNREWTKSLLEKGVSQVYPAR